MDIVVGNLGEQIDFAGADDTLDSELTDEHDENVDINAGQNFGDAVQVPHAVGFQASDPTDCNSYNGTTTMAKVEIQLEKVRGTAGRGQIKY